MSDAIDHRCLEWMPKTLWGPIKWKELHSRALMPLPMAEEQEWFHAFVEGLPCRECRRHFEDFMREHPPDLQSREAFFKWTVRAHNHVNGTLGKRQLSFEEARQAHPEVFAEP